MITVTILLPPSEGKTDGGSPEAPWGPERTKIAGAAGTAIGRARLEVAAALSRARGGDEKLLGVGGTHLARARSANSRLIGAPTLPAWRRYSGVVWEHLDLASMPASDRRRVLGSLWVASALAGLVRGDESLPDYRLKMSARPVGLGTLSTWWRPTTTAALSTVARRTHVIDLLPTEHRAAFDWAAIAAAGVPVSRIEFVARSGPSGGHFAKAAKGAFARHVLERAVDLGSRDDVPAALARMVRGFRHGTHSARLA